MLPLKRVSSAAMESAPQRWSLLRGDGVSSLIGGVGGASSAALESPPQRRYSGFMSSRVRRNKSILEKITQLSLKQTNTGCPDPVPPKRVRISGHFSGKITTAIHSMEVSMPVNHEVPCDAMEPLLEALVYAAKNHEDGNSHDHSHDDSRHAQHDADIAGSEVWTCLLGFLQAAQNEEIQIKQRDIIAASFLGVMPTKNKLQAAAQLIKDLNSNTKADEQMPCLVDGAEEREVEEQEEPAMEPEAWAGVPETNHCIASPARSAEAGHTANDELVKELISERDQLRLELDAWQSDQTASLQQVHERGMQVPEAAWRRASRSPTPRNLLAESTLLEESRRLISTLEQEFQEKAQQLGEQLVEVQTLKGRVSQQQVDLECLKSKNTRLEISLRLAESEAQILTDKLRPFGKSSSEDTSAFLRSCSSQASTSPSPRNPHILVSVRPLAQDMEMLHSPVGALASNSSSSSIASRQPNKLSFMQMASPSGPVGTFKAAAVSAASMNASDSRLQHSKSTHLERLGARTPPRMAERLGTRTPPRMAEMLGTRTPPRMVEMLGTRTPPRTAVPSMLSRCRSSTPRSTSRLGPNWPRET